VKDRATLSWQKRTVGSFQTVRARAAGQKRLETYRALWQQAIWKFNGDDLV